MDETPEAMRARLGRLALEAFAWPNMEDTRAIVWETIAKAVATEVLSRPVPWARAFGLHDSSACTMQSALIRIAAANQSSHYLGVDATQQLQEALDNAARVLEEALKR